MNSGVLAILLSLAIARCVRTRSTLVRGGVTDVLRLIQSCAAPAERALHSQHRGPNVVASVAGSPVATKKHRQ